MAAQERRSKAASRRKSPVKPGAPAKAAKVPAKGEQAASKGKGVDGLTDQQRQFYRAYQLHHNGTKAAIESGYSPASAAVTACRMLKHPKIRALIDQDEQEAKAEYEQEIAQASTDYDITPGRILREWARIAFFDSRKLYERDGSLKPLHELDDDTAAALTGLDVQELWGGAGEDRQVIGVLKKWRAASKEKALDALSKHKNLYAVDNEGKVQPFAQALAGFIGQMHSAGGSKLPIRAPVERKA